MIDFLKSPDFYAMLDAKAQSLEAGEIRESPEVYRNNLRIDMGEGRIVPLGHVVEPFQAEDFAALDSGWEAVVLGRGHGKYQNAYLERPKGHSKTTDIAAMATWALYAAPRPLIGIVASGKEDQAGFVRDKIREMLRLNEWLDKEIECKRHVTNRRTGSQLRIIATEEATVHGETPDFIIVDELTHWRNSAFWTAVCASAGKRSRCMLVVIANAGLGLGVSWQWNIREEFRQNPKAYFHRLDGPVAKWVTPDALDFQKRTIPSREYLRLWMNQWQAGTGDILDMALVLAAVVLPGPTLRQNMPISVGGLDMGITHDHAAFCVLGGDPHTRKIKLQHTRHWNPKDFPGGRIPISIVEAHVIETCKRLEVSGIVVDPHQAEGSIELFQSHGIKCQRETFNARGCDDMAKALLDAFNRRDVELYDDQWLITDLSRLVIEQRLTGYRITAPKDERGHCDLATAFVLALPWVIGTIDAFQVDAA